MHFQSTSTTDSDDPGAQQQPVAAAECAWASCEIGGTLSVSDSYIDALVKGMNEVFTQQRGISPQAVVEYFRNCRDFSNDPLGVYEFSILSLI